MKMRVRVGFFLLAFLGFFSAFSSALKCPGVAHYKLSFYGKWSNMTHPNAVPTKGFPMFSPWVGASHSADYSMWKPGMMASEGVQQVAETGTLFFVKLFLNYFVFRQHWIVHMQTLSSHVTTTAIQILSKDADYKDLSDVCWS